MWTPGAYHQVGLLQRSDCDDSHGALPWRPFCTRRNRFPSVCDRNFRHGHSLPGHGEDLAPRRHEFVDHRPRGQRDPRSSCRPATGVVARLGLHFSTTSASTEAASPPNPATAGKRDGPGHDGGPALSPSTFSRTTRVFHGSSSKEGGPGYTPGPRVQTSIHLTIFSRRRCFPSHVAAPRQRAAAELAPSTWRARRAAAPFCSAVNTL